MTSPRVDPPLADNGARLGCLAELALEFGVPRIAQAARDLGDRLADGLFYVACVGQFKRGKSTLLGALVGERLLPTGVIPVTTVPTVVRYGPAGRARVRLGDGAWEDISADAIGAFVSQEHNPDNSQRVGGVEVFSPAPLLAGGMCLVDTPGLGSVFAGNTAATRAFIPHTDAALVVFGADPPLTGEELDLVAEVAAQVGDLVFVLNKADRMSAEDRAAAVAFSRRMIEQRLGRAAGPIHQVSALERMKQMEASSGRPPSPDWQALVDALQRLATDSGRQLAHAAVARGTRRLCDQLLAVIAEQRAALERPLEDSERRIAGLRATAAAAERSLADIGYLFNGEQRKLTEQFIARRREFLGAACPAAAADLEVRLRALARGSGPAFRHAALAAAQATAHERVLPWLEGEQAAAAAAFRAAAARFIEIANGFLSRAAEMASWGLGAVPEAAPGAAGLRAASQFYFYDFIAIAQPASPLRYLADTARGWVGAYGKIAADAFAFLDLLLETNAARVQNDLDRRLAESRAKLEAEIKTLLREVAAVASEALKRSRATQAEGAAAVAARLEQLAAREREVRELWPANPSSD